MVGLGVGGRFDQATLLERLRQGPPAEDPAGAAGSAPIQPSRWTLARIRAAVPPLADYSLSGVWRVLQRCRLRLRSAAVEQWSPDPDYASKLARLEAVLREAGARPGQVVVVFMDQMGFSRWPDPGRDWTGVAPHAPPLARRGGAPTKPWRLVGALDATSGQVQYRDGYIIGRKDLGTFYRQLNRAYPQAERIYVIQDNWSIHTHPDVLAALARLPRIEPVFLPTYAPWLNPIEKLWRWLRQAVLTNHRWAADWDGLLDQVHGFLDQFADGSDALLRYVGLHGDGRLAQALRPPECRS